MFNYSFDIAALILYVIIGLYFLQRRHIKNEQHSILGALIIVASIVTVFDILGGVSIECDWNVGTVYVLNEIYYLAQCVFSYIFMVFVLSHLEISRKKAAFHRVLIAVPVLIMILLILSNNWTGWLFTFSHPSNWVYGPLRLLIYIEYQFYFIWAAIYVITRRSQLTMHFAARIHTIVCLNFLPIIMQYFSFGQLMKSYSAALSVLIIWFGELSNEASIDANTGLSNYAYMCQNLKRLMYNKMPFRAILVRIGDYDLLNTSYGIENTDKLADEVARHLSHWVGSGYSFKYSSSSFALIFEGEDIDELEKKVYNGLNHVWHIDGLDMTPSFFVTCIPYPECVQDLDDFIAHASYFQKMHRMRYGIVPEEELHVRDRVHEQTIINALQRGLDNGGFHVHYQPIYDIKNEKYVTAEVLARLNDVKLGNIPPVEFIPLAEENGMIIRLGYKVIDQVCTFIEEHDLNELGLEYIELNLSVVQCLQRDFIERLTEIIEEHNVRPNQLCLEITETAANCAPEIFTYNLERLKEMGFLLALDDYGTGYANLERMVQNDFNFIKFDKEMIQKGFRKPKLLAIFDKLQNIFHSMGSEIVAEGVETKEQLEAAMNAGVDYIQGYYFSEPLPVDDFVTFLKEHK